ncbi:SMP-30/gluconolactonase/LRE family protein [Roseateles albus]|uniref:SMP-30/gluconolactonase/LRE family protein n=1 Tax=Roseateles albus TaxID=2987525 RepID=A0ABT5KET2_9BURK|nr:SMP-30/gluconolactonase/LRE family protein [Roseateles albus]MDC8772428.1 SMP-30/gluconolactonase/LRE family protein [Roseateles albus]
MNASDSTLYQIEAAGPAVAALGESPLWSVAEQCLYYVDIPKRQVLRLEPVTAELRHWQLDSEPGCIALIEGGGLAVAQRDGLWHLNTETGAQRQLAAAPFDSTKQRFNDGKPDAQGRFWIGTIDDARAPHAGLYRYASGCFESMAEGIVTSNGVAWSPDQRKMYWSDTKAHEVYVLDFDLATGAIGERAMFAKFAQRTAGEALDQYGGRPDGAAVDVEGCYWVAMFEGQRLLRLSPQGQVLRELRLPVRCPTMPTFGGVDLRTLYITTASEGRSAEELAAQPLAGCVLKVRVEVAGLAPNLLKL